MTEQLTDNTDEWPVGPFELLGIPRTAERAEIRRAYSVLIRRFRPETHPKQFQRVREAFEAVLVAIETRGQNSADIRIDLTALIPREDAVALQRPLESQSATPVAASTFSDAADLVWSRFSNAPDVSQYNDIRKLTASAGFLVHSNYNIPDSKLERRAQWW